MWNLRDLSIKGLLKASLLVTATIATLVAALVFVVVDLAEFRDQRGAQIERTAERVALDVRDAVLARDFPRVTDRLGDVAGSDLIASACLLDPQRRIIARVGPVDLDEITIPAGARGIANHPTEDRLIAFVPIHGEGEVRGTIYLESALLDYAPRMVRNAWIIAGLLGFALLLSWWLSSRMQRLVADPILELVRTMRQVSQRRGYAARAKRMGQGELATLIDGFNEMLAQIERRDQMVVASRDRAEAATKAKSEFLATMSHEIRTPLNAIVGITRLLSETDLTDTLASDVRTVLDSAEHLLGLLNDVLDFSKIEAGKLEVEGRDVDLRQTVDAVTELFAQRAELKGLELVADVPSGFPSHLKSDEARIRQILNNLVGNALKFTHEGDVVIRMRAIDENEDGILLRIEVNDTGVGIPEEACERLFQPFQQADSSTTREYGGTGLGLAISRKLVSLLGGEIGVHSEEGRGSSFWFELRTRRMSDLAVPAEAVPSFLRDLHVLIVESHDTSRAVMRNYLQSWGARVDAVATHDDALALLRKCMVTDVHELVLLGDRPSDEDPTRLLDGIAEHYKLNVTRVVLCAYPNHLAERKRTKHARISGYVTRPVRRAVLLNCLSAIWLPPSGAGSDCEETPVTGGEREDDGPAILLAEDNVVNQMVALRMLKKLCYRAELVVNGKEAVDAAARRDFDLILMDCQMPEMDGYEATQEIRRIHGNERHVPIIAVTANALRGDRERCLSAGMDDHVAKPVKPQVLDEVIRKWLGVREGVDS